MDVELRAALAALASDAESGASELLPRALSVLRAASRQGREPLEAAARALCGAQPSMASFWNAAAAALLERTRPGTLERFEQRAMRAGAALRRVAVEALLPPGANEEARRAPDHGRAASIAAANEDVRPAPADSDRLEARATGLHLTTFSYSGSVLSTLLEIARRVPLTVACAEGRPRFEGRRLAAALAGAGIRVEFYTDAAIGDALDRTRGVVIGADAITPSWILNKCGTALLAAAASFRGVPVFVLAARDKFLPPPLAGSLWVLDRDASEVWDAPPDRVFVHNAYFGRVPLTLITAIATDAGLLGIDMVEEACRANGLGLSDEVLRPLLDARARAM